MVYVRYLLFNDWPAWNNKKKCMCVRAFVRVLHIIIVMFEPILMCSIHFLYAVTNFHILYVNILYQLPSCSL